MSSIERLAKMFKERDNPVLVNITIGEVLSVDPLKVKWGENVILDQRHLVLTQTLNEGFIVEYEDDTGTSLETKEITIKNPIAIGDHLLMIPNNEFSKWYALDKVVI